MKETIFLVVSRRTVERMTKNMPALNRGEIPIKVEVTVEESAFREPVLVKEVYVEDWREGIDIADIDFKQTFLTEEEAEIIRARRLDEMKKILESKGYSVSEPQATTEPEGTNES